MCVAAEWGAAPDTMDCNDIEMCIMTSEEKSCTCNFSVASAPAAGDPRQGGGPPETRRVRPCLLHGAVRGEAHHR